jgi:hypothetical protein
MHRRTNKLTPVLVISEQGGAQQFIGALTQLFSA